MIKSPALCLGFLLLSLTGLQAADSVVVFNEVSYHPASSEGDNEWIELHNQMAIDIDLSGWRLDDGVSYTFAEGVIIPGGGYLVVAGNPAALQTATGLAGIKGPFTGGLNNSGERLDLRDRNGRLMDRMEYGDGSKWPLAADGSGATLAKRNPDATSAEPEHWTSSVVIGGTPGARNFPDTTVVVRPLITMSDLWRFEASGTDLSTGWRAANFNDSAWAGQNAATLVAYWPFNGNATATRGVNGAFSGAVTATTDRNNAAGAALAFSGSLQYVSVAGGGGLNGATAGTVGLWAKWNGASQDADCCGSFGAVLARQGNGLFSDDILALDAANPAAAHVVWRQSGGPAPVLVKSTSVVGNTWHHIAVTFSPAGSTLYFDGVAQASATGSGMSNNAGVPLSIGAWAGDGAGFMNGSLDDVAVWDQPLTAAQIAQIAGSTKTPLDFDGPQRAVYYSGDGHLATNDELRKTLLPSTPVTTYFRKAFTFSDDIAHTQLKMDLALDDGAVFYLNGSEIYRHNMPGTAVSFSTLASTAIGDAPLLTNLSLPAGNLVSGTNVLAVEVHQAVAGDPGMVFGAGVNAVITPAGTEALLPDNLVF
ncbi:MAG TPA: LamG-like jellyroll fold domain-containing protein, partial [Verrucomicrobiales bacterium]|nr:LamG-like jellyroll fold domain-containing protein [Verrucomicrobiales bacterium]